jgi:hypothetical protein
MSALDLNDILSALVAKLQAHTDVQAVLGQPARVVDGALNPQQAVFPYLLISKVEQRDKGAKGLAQIELEIALRILTKSHKPDQVRAVISALTTCLQDEALALATGVGSVTRVQLLNSQSFPNPQGGHYEGLYKIYLMVSAGA